MNFFGGNPLDLLVIKACLPDAFDKLISGGQLNRGVLLEDKSFVVVLGLFFVLH
jgi:hypothetical protein